MMTHLEIAKKITKIFHDNHVTFDAKIFKAIDDTADFVHEFGNDRYDQGHTAGMDDERNVHFG